MNQEKNGLISVTIPGKVDPNGVHSKYDGGGKAFDTGCIWFIDVPPNQSVRLETVTVDDDSRLSVHCGANGAERVLETGKSALLHGCARATLTWTIKVKPGSDPHYLHLFYESKSTYIITKLTVKVESFI